MSGDRDNFFHEERVGKSRKPYTCAICRRSIPTGSSYVRVSVANLGERASHAAHEDCLAAALEGTSADHSARNFAGGAA